MPQSPKHAYSAANMILCLHESSHFIFEIISKYSSKILHSKRVSKIFTFYIKNGNFCNFLTTKSDPNIIGVLKGGKVALPPLLKLVKV